MSNYIFSLGSISFLVCIVKAKGVKLKANHIFTISTCFEQESVCEIKNFLESANFYRRYIREFLRKKHPLTDITKQEVNRRKKDKTLLKTNFLTQKACRFSFELLATFTSLQFFI